MNFALQKTLELVIIICLGLLMQKKVAKADLKGIKSLILTIALPATIFVALLKIKLDSSLWIFPFLALSFNLIMLVATKYLISSSLYKNAGDKKRTLMMLLPSLAPGLSCFPFIAVYLGDDSLALAALSDVGNKIFVLILLYILAMQWYNLRLVKKAKATAKNKLKSLFLSMLNEPINMVIIIALILLGFGLNLASLPNFLGKTIKTMSVLMTPLVLLFIGMAVRIKFSEFGFIFSLLIRRAGITFFLSAIFVYLFPTLTPALILLLVVFPQSSCSFWPFAHMSAVNTLEEKDEQEKPTFDINFAVNVLACSLPFSTILIISIFSFGEFFVKPNFLMVCGLLFVGISFLPSIFVKFKKKNLLNESQEISV